METTTNPSIDWEKELEKVCDDAAYFNDGLLDASSRKSLHAFIQSLLSRKEEEVRKKVMEFIRAKSNSYNINGKFLTIDESVLEAATHPKQ